MASSHPKGEHYFIALVPPEPVFERTWKVKEQMSETYETKGALKSPPHITLHMPFRMKEEHEEELVEILQEVGNGTDPFSVELDGYNAFPPRVIYLDVVVTGELRELHERVRRTMQRLLHTENADWQNRGFVPHLTVAFRDLKKPAFRKAWAEVKDREFRALWEAENMTLLRHDGKRWNEYRTIPFRK